jgi:hypothetical protein
VFAADPASSQDQSNGRDGMMGGGAGMMKGGGMSCCGGMMGGTMEEMRDIHRLLANHEEIQRT